MNLQDRIQFLVKLGNYMQSDAEEWQLAKQLAHQKNGWFLDSFIENACHSIANNFLKEDLLQNFASKYSIPNENKNLKNVGIVMAGNIPLVGFHDWLCVFLTGHEATIKASSKDEVLIKHLISILYSWEVTIQNKVSFAQTLKGCDAYIATGSNNSSRYFDYYFNKYPSIIRQNKTSVAIINGNETKEELLALANDVQLYFGQGCRNVTHLIVPENYDFALLLEALSSFDYLLDYHKYKNNFDYQLTLLLLNNKKYITNGSILLSNDEGIFSPISQLNYSYYQSSNAVLDKLSENKSIQCIVGKDHIAFGKAQNPSLSNFADGIDTMSFLLAL